MKAWDDLPNELRTDAVKPYYEILAARRMTRFLKWVFDRLAALVLILLLSPVLLVLMVWVKLDSPGPVFFRQLRVTRYGRPFRIFKFRTMVQNADKLGAQVTTDHDPRVTRVGNRLRDHRLDELPQLFNVLVGQMSFVGTRPEVPRYVEAYSPEMYATLLMPAGVTSETSLRFKDEAELLKEGEDVDRIYKEKVLPLKMRYNLEALKGFSLKNELMTLIHTVTGVFGDEGSNG